MKTDEAAKGESVLDRSYNIIAEWAQQVGPLSVSREQFTALQKLIYASLESAVALALEAQQGEVIAAIEANLQIPHGASGLLREGFLLGKKAAIEVVTKTMTVAAVKAAASPEGAQEDGK
jgi:hypothetical protein